MYIKDCKIGTRVICVDSIGIIPVGAVGIIIEDGSDCPFVSWDEHFNDSQYEYDGYENVYAVYLQEIEVVKEDNKDILKVVLQELYNGIETLSKDLDGGVVEKGQVLTEQVVLDNLLYRIDSAVNSNDGDTALKLSKVYQRIKSVQTI